jgi:hypothetical protein
MAAVLLVGFHVSTDIIVGECLAIAKVFVAQVRGFGLCYTSWWGQWKWRHCDAGAATLTPLPHRVTPLAGRLTTPPCHVTPQLAPRNKEEKCFWDNGANTVRIVHIIYHPGKKFSQCVSNKIFKK